jgi:hypothetical protein
MSEHSEERPGWPTLTSEDDWFFDEPEAGPAEAEQPPAGVARQHPRLRVGVPAGRMAVFAGGAIAILLLALAVSGVFSGTSKPPPPTTPRTTPAAHRHAPTVALPGGFLHLGESGARVKALQKALTAAGYSPGKADGVFGANTQQELLSFQNSVHLRADGSYGPKTKAALARVLNAR